LFRRTRMTEIDHGETRRDLIVNVEETAATTVGYGAGFEVRLRPVKDPESGGVASEALEFAPRVSFEVGRRNLLGKNRSVNLFTSLSLHPKDQTSVAPSGGPFDFPEYLVTGTLREPRVLNSTVDGFVTGLLQQQKRSSFDIARRGASAGVTRQVNREV